MSGMTRPNVSGGHFFSRKGLYTRVKRGDNARGAGRLLPGKSLFTYDFKNRFDSGIKSDG